MPSLMLLALTLGASTAFGQSVKACRSTTNGNLRQVSSAADCKPNEEYVLWSVTGAQGPQGAQGPAGAPTLTTGAAYLGITVTNARINGGGNQAHVAPGLPFTLDFDFNNTQSWCPGCIVQTYVGLNSDVSKPQACASSVIAGATPGTTSHSSVLLTAPLIHGVYYIGIDRDLQFSCFGGGQVWPSGSPTTPNRYIAAVTVY
jgi:hypothetical protein